MFPITTRLSGVTYDEAQTNIKRFGCADIRTYALIREPENAHDSNAIRVALFGHYYMGYIPKHISRNLAPVIDSGGRLIAEFVGRNEHPHHDVVGLTIRIVQVSRPNIEERRPL